MAEEKLVVTDEQLETITARVSEKIGQKDEQPSGINHEFADAAMQKKYENTWKIWHLHWFRFIKCSYDKGWVKDTSMMNRPNIPVHPLSKYVTYHNPYSPLSVRDGIPACPRPYDTWTDSDWMLNKDKSK